MKSRIYSGLLVGLFCLLLCVPGLTMLVHPETPNMYGVKHVAYPRFEASFPWLSRFEEYFTANLGHKQRFICLTNWLGYQVLHDLQSDNVLVGKHDWLFLKQDLGWKSFRSEQPLEGAEAQQWRASLAGAAKLLAARGIRLLYVIVPSKETIYPELLPPGAVRARNTTRLDETLQMLGELQIDYIDLRAPLLTAKREAQLYDSNDSHWNGRGARVGAERILTRVQEILQRPPGYADLNSHLTPNTSWGDLPLILAMEKLFGTPSVELVVNERRATRLVPPERVANPSRQQVKEMVYEAPDDSLPRALIIRDSFGFTFSDTLVEKFQRSTWLWTHDLDLRLLDREKPDIVIVEQTERFFSGSAPKVLTAKPRRRQ